MTKNLAALIIGLFYSTVVLCQHTDLRVLGRDPQLHVTIAQYTDDTQEDTAYSFTVTLIDKGQKRIFRIYHDIGLYPEMAYDTCFIESRQLDGKGLPELIVTFPVKMVGGGGSGTITTEVCIWNLDLQKEIFHAITRYDASSTSHWFKSADDETSEPDSASTSTLTESENDSIQQVKPDESEGLEVYLCRWSYDLKVTDKGAIILSNLQYTPAVNEITTPDGKVIKRVEEPDPHPDHQPGTYVLERGMFVLRTSKQ